MIVLSYGMMKSGSTLAFELCKSILEQNGFRQDRLPDGMVVPGHDINFIREVKAELLRRILHEVGPDRKIAIKVHAPIRKTEIPFVERAIEEGKIEVLVNYRDPREICLSLVDAGAKAREQGNPAFAEIRSLSDAAVIVQRQLSVLHRWGSMKGVVLMFYNDVAFRTRLVVDVLCKHFGFGLFDDETYNAVVGRVFNEAFTQKNKAVKDRYKDDLTVRQNEMLLGELKGASAFIDKVCEARDLSWFETPFEPLRDPEWIAKEAALRAEAKAIRDTAGGGDAAEDMAAE